jgi:predicted  nucleic acid-binding Zn-ribbon protein
MSTINQDAINWVREEFESKNEIISALEDEIAGLEDALALAEAKVAQYRARLEAHLAPQDLPVCDDMYDI